jgi:hypothetical protein
MNPLRIRADSMRYMRCLAPLLLALFIPGCGLSPSREVGTKDTDALVCKIGPNGGPVLSERGMGGTGISTGHTLMTERGLGGTGIIGVVTGFASICVNGLEVAYDPATPVMIGGTPADANALRAGQVVAIEAAGRAVSQARKISIIYQVSGPIESVTGPGRMQVAGQTVMVTSAVSPQSWSLRAGEWVNVSGLPSPNGEIAASRIDRREPGRVIVRGRLSGSAGAFRLGDLRVRLPSHSQVASGELVVAAGSYKDGILAVDAISVDLPAADPVAFFGSGVDHFYIQAFARLADGRVLSSSGWAAPAAPGLQDGTKSGRPGVIELVRRKDGSTVVTRFGDPSAGIPSPGGFSPTERGVQLQPFVPTPDPGRPGAPAGNRSSPGNQPGGPGGSSQPGGPGGGFSQPGGPIGFPQPGGGGPGFGRGGPGR